MTPFLGDRPPCTIRVEQLNHAQWEARSDRDGSISGVRDFVSATAEALNWARYYGDGVELVPYADRRLTLQSAVPNEIGTGQWPR